MAVMRGKWAEAEVRDVLAALEKELFGFAFNRIPDAHGGFLQPAAADFQWFLDTGMSCAPYEGPPHGCDVCDTSRDDPPYTRNGLIEVKEVEHLSRLPHRNFSNDKIARMRKRQAAGGETLVLVAHKLKGMRKPQVTWRAIGLQYFVDNPGATSSWDLSEFPHINMEQTLRSWIKDNSRPSS